jgi:hypothetical protein
MTTTIKPNTFWQSVDRKVFQVTHTENNWVFYTNTTTKQEYSCLEESFLFRFITYENS